MAKRKIIGKKHGNRRNISKNAKRIKSNNEILKRVPAPVNPDTGSNKK